MVMLMLEVEWLPFDVLRDRERRRKVSFYSTRGNARTACRVIRKRVKNKILSLTTCFRRNIEYRTVIRGYEYKGITMTGLL